MSALDFGVLLAFGCAVAWIGFRTGRGVHSEEELHLAGRKLPTWVVFGSMVATELSAATFIGVPQAARAGDWSYLELAFGALAGKSFVAARVIPLYHQGRHLTVYSYLRDHYGAELQRTTAMVFVVGRILASGARLFIAASALAFASGLSVEVAIVASAAMATAYTWLGGLRSVVWTDLLQAAVFVAAALAMLAALGIAIAPEWQSFLEWSAQGAKLRIFHGDPWLSLSDTRLFPVAFVGGFFLTLATSGTDHDMAQRLLGARGAREGGRALLGSALANLPLTALFLAIGTGLAFAETRNLVPGLAGADSPVPAFALHGLPSGLRGLVFTGIFAAALSSLDSALCAISSTWCVDIAPRPDEDPMARARRACVGVALALLLAALAMSAIHAHLAAGGRGPNLVEFALSAMSIVYGGLLGVFAIAWLGLPRGNGSSARAGLATGAVFGLALFLHPLWLGYPVIGWTWWIPIAACASLAVTAARPRSKSVPTLSHEGSPHP